MRRLQTWILAASLVLAAVAVAACGGGGGGGGASTSPSSGGTSGSQSSPALGTSYPFQGGGFAGAVMTSSWTVPGTASDTVSVVVDVTALHGVLGSLVGEGSLDPNCPGFDFGTDLGCVLTQQGGTTSGIEFVDRNGTGIQGVLTVATTQNLGSISAPVPFTEGSMIYGTVDALGKSRFSFTASATASYTIGFTGLFPQLSFELFDDPGFSHQIAQATAASQGSPELMGTASLTAGNAYYLQVEETAGAPQIYRFAVNTSGANEGSVAQPVAISVVAFGGTARLSSIDQFGHSYYTFTPNSTGSLAIAIGQASIVVDGSPGNADSDFGWTLFSDAGFSAPIKTCHDYRVAASYELCLAQVTADTPYYLRLDEYAGLVNRRFTLKIFDNSGVAPHTPQDAGSVASPITVASTSLPTTLAGIGPSSHGYFTFTTGSNPQSARILTSPTDPTNDGTNLSWTLFSDSGFSVPLMTCNRAKGAVVQGCLTPVLGAATPYFVRVDEMDNSPSAFGITYQTGFSPVTASNSGAPISVPTGAGGVATTSDTLADSFFSFQTGSAGPYRIEAVTQNNENGLAAWGLFDDPGFTHQIAQCYLDMIPPDLGGFDTACTLALAGATTYYLHVQLTSFASGISPQPILAPVGLNVFVNP